MKKRILTILACVLMLINVFAFSACGNSELEAKIAELEAKIELREKTIRNFVQEEFCTLDEAFNLGLLTKDDLISIAYYHHNGPDYPTSLSDEVAMSIKRAAAEKLRYDEIYPIPEGTAEPVVIEEYYGTYNNCVVIMLSYAFAMETTDYVPITIEVGGVEFHFGHIRHVPRLVVWVTKGD